MQLSKHFQLIDFLNGGPTQQELCLENEPKNADTIQAISELSKKILDPIVENFGQVEVTFGFCSQELAREIKKRPKPNIAPELDQHAGHELNNIGNRVCKRDGFAVDFKVNGYKSSEIAFWAQANLPFDRIYFYGDNRPLHISYAPEPLGQMIDMRPVNGRRIPKKVTDPQLLFQPK